MKLSSSVAVGFFLATIVSAQVPAELPQQLTPAQQKIAAAQKAIESAPERYQSYNQMAVALERRARETGDVSLYAQAEEALNKSLQLSAANLEAQKVKASLLLGEHCYEQALELASSVNKLWPDDVLIYGYIADAQMALGNYAAAEEATQWMLNLRPGNIPAMRRTAGMREVYGDLDGAAEMLTNELIQTAPNESADRAYVLTRLAHLQLAVGHVTEAEKYLQQARRAFPNLPYTLETLAELRRAQGNYHEAAQVLNQLYLMIPAPGNSYKLAVALERENRREYAQSLFQEFERKALEKVHAPDNANLDLVFFYADHARKPQEALRIAKIQFSRLQNVYARDAYAWALAVNGQTAEARKRIDAALAIGVRDPRLFYHAGAIAAQEHDSTAAAAYFKASLDVNPLSEFAAMARQALEKLPATSAIVASAN